MLQCGYVGRESCMCRASGGPRMPLFSHLRAALTPHVVRGSSAHPSMPRTLLMGLEPMSRGWQIGALTM